jgi:hypothetical protein
MAIWNGTVFPFFAIIFAEMISALSLPDSPDFKERTNLLSLMFLVNALAAFLSQAL